MPIVVDWTPVNQMGSLALSTGQAQGRAAGQNTFLQRQDRVDAQSADINQRNRELGFAATQQPIQDAQHFRQQTALQDRAFAQQQSLADTRGQYALQGAEIRSAGQSPEELAAAAYARASGRNQARSEFTQRNDDMHRQQYVARAVQMGQTQEQASMDYDQLLQQQTAHQAGTPIQGPRRKTFRPTGEMRSMAYGAAQLGNFQGIAQAVAGGVNINPEQTILEAQDGITMALMDESLPLQAAQAAVNDPSLPPWIKAAAQAAIARRGDVRFGTNQARPQRDLSGVPDDVLLRAIQGNFAAPGMR